ncbi:biotin-dependent carboxyltransferase family protein [Rhodococcus sp. D2-41]|nr:biotin-dependent carboxyltransferase family protein [Rhodococcus sp. D2-41]
MRVSATGPLCTVQDLGRPGWFHAGVGVSGAADRRSLTLANRLLANDENAAAVECLLGGLVVEARGTVLFAVTGAPCPVDVDSTPVAHSSVVVAQPGQRIRIGVADAGLRCYLAVRGGLDVPAVLGSRSRDTLAGIGPAPLQPGDLLAVGPPPSGWPRIGAAPVAPIGNDPLTVRIVFGPRDDWFTEPEVLCTATWTVSPDSDRIGVRLHRPSGAPTLRRARTGELPTEGMALGAVQVPPSGQPVVFLADHPITGGYPVVATVVHDDVALLAQARPGREVRFRPVAR